MPLFQSQKKDPHRQRFEGLFSRINYSGDDEAPGYPNLSLTLPFNRRFVFPHAEVTILAPSAMIRTNRAKVFRERLARGGFKNEETMSRELFGFLAMFLNKCPREEMDNSGRDGKDYVYIGPPLPFDCEVELIEGSVQVGKIFFADDCTLESEAYSRLPAVAAYQVLPSDQTGQPSKKKQRHDASGGNGQAFEATTQTSSQQIYAKPNGLIYSEITDLLGAKTIHGYLLMDVKYSIMDTDSGGVEANMMVRHEGIYQMLWYMHVAAVSGKLRRQHGISVINNRMLRFVRLMDGSIMVQGCDGVDVNATYTVDELESYLSFWIEDFGTSLATEAGMAAFLAQVQVASFHAAVDTHTHPEHDAARLILPSYLPRQTTVSNPLMTPGMIENMVHDAGGDSVAAGESGKGCTGEADVTRYPRESSSTEGLYSPGGSNSGKFEDHSTEEPDDSILLPIERFRASVRNAAIKIRLAPPSVMQALTTQMCHAFTLEEVIEQAAATYNIGRRILDK